MTFDEAVAELTKRFGPPAAAKGFDAGETLHIASGGKVANPIDESPALVKDRALAIRLWYEAALLELSARTFEAWAFLSGPHNDLWRITIQDEKCTHRIAADRFSVISTIGLKGVASPEA